MAARVHPALLTGSYPPRGYDYFPFDHGGSFPEDFMMRAEPESNEAEEYASFMMGIQHVMSDSAVGEASTRAPSFSATPMLFEMVAGSAGSAPGHPHSTSRGIGPAKIQHMSIATPHSHLQRVSEWVHLEGLSSESPEEKILTPASSLRGPPSHNEDVGESYGEDAYSSLSDWSPCLPTLTADHDLPRQRGPLPLHNATPNTHVTERSSHLAAHSGAHRNSALGQDGRPSGRDPSYPTSTSTPSGSEDWMANQEDYVAHADEPYVARFHVGASHDPTGNPSLQDATFATAGHPTYVQVPNPIYHGPYTDVPGLIYQASLAPRFDEYNTGGYSLAAGVLPSASFTHYPDQPIVQHPVALQQNRLQYHHVVPTALPSTQDGAITHDSYRGQPMLPPTRPAQHQQRPQHSIAMQNTPRNISQPREEGAMAPSQTSHKASRTLPSKHTGRVAPAASDLSLRKLPERIAPVKQSGSPQSRHSSTATPRSVRVLPVLVKAEPGQALIDPRRQAQTKSRRGGREKNSRLPDSKKDKISKIRHSGACWKCAFQRDPCDGNYPCGRCAGRSQRAGAFHFPCNRTKLPELLPEFLPPTMTLVHARQTIEDTVHKEVRVWGERYPIDVYLTSGYGPPLRWTVFEFQPRTEELLTQLQYFHNPATGVSEGRYKYSPPFGLMKLDENDDAHVQHYLDRLMHEQYLDDLGWTCFEEEGHADAGAFQCNLLNFMCTLYLHTEDEELREVLQSVIRMMIITYIMAHTLTITEDTLPTVISSVQMSAPPAHVTRHTSPRLANRQLKFFFAVLRQKIYERILNWQQQTLHNSARRESTWLTSFCAMLGFAMVLEEVQRALQIQADAKAKKNEMPAAEARIEACNACKRIDDRYDLLVVLFQAKYLHKKLGVGSFGPGSPRYGGHAEHQFLTQLRGLVEEKAAYLESRQAVACTPENHCRYTSRLVARFLLPFLTLPRA